jgi:hypothetical protein
VDSPGVSREPSDAVEEDVEVDADVEPDVGLGVSATDSVARSEARSEAWSGRPDRWAEWASAKPPVVTATTAEVAT